MNTISLITRTPAQPGNPVVYEQLQDLQGVLKEARSQLAGAEVGLYDTPVWAVQDARSSFAHAADRLVRAVQIGADLPESATSRRVVEDTGQAWHQTRRALDELLHAPSVAEQELYPWRCKWVTVDRYFTAAGLESTHQARNRAIYAVDDAAEGVSRLAEHAKPVPASTKLTTAGGLVLLGAAAVVGVSLLSVSRSTDR